jgi:hypothetical protein
MATNFDEKGKIFTAVVTKKPVPVIIQTTLSRVEGKIFVRPDERIKDEMDRPEPFLAVTDVKIFSLDSQLMAEAPFIAINRSQIIWVLPVENLGE